VKIWPLAVNDRKALADQAVAYRKLGIVMMKSRPTASARSRIHNRSNRVPKLIVPAIHSPQSAPPRASATWSPERRKNLSPLHYENFT